MGSLQSYISSEAAFTTLFIVGAIGLGYTQLGHGAASANTPPQTKTPGQPTNKGKKKKQTNSSIVLNGDISDKGGARTNDPSQQLATSTTFAELGRVANAPAVVPGQFESTSTPDSRLSDVAAAAGSSLSKAKKSKKKAKAAVITDPIVEPITASCSVDYSSEISVKLKSKNGKRQLPPQPSSSSQTTRPLQQSTASIDTDGSWTRVGSVRRDTTLSKISTTTSINVTTSDPDTGLTPHTGSSSPNAERGTEVEEPSSFLLGVGSRDSGENRRKTLAEKLLPKPRKTGVDDMLETSDYPTLARVMRVQPLPDEKPASGFSWGDYEDVRVATDGGENDADGEDDGWGVVSKRQRVERTSTLASHHPHQVLKASETMTKRQRQNAHKRENVKAAKGEAETRRLAVLAKHNRELERTRALEQYSGQASSKSPSGGMKASVDEGGKLFWE